MSEPPETQFPSVCNTATNPRQMSKPKKAYVNTLKNGQFMSAVDAWKTIQFKDYVFEGAPAVNKSNVWFLVNNTDNIKRATKGRTVNTVMAVVCGSLQKAKCITKTTRREEYIYKTYQ